MKLLGYIILGITYVPIVTICSDVSHHEEVIEQENAYKLIEAYSGLVISYDNNYIFFSDGDSLIYDDGISKEHIELLDNADIEDMLSNEYKKDSLPEYLSDVGRIRCDAFFRKIYGNSESEVRRSLVQVDWLGEKLMFSSVNDADRRLMLVAKELSSHPELTEYLKGASTFNWRKVRGANRMSAHSYGIAIDINIKFSDYWLWSNQHISETDSLKYKNRIPHKLVEIFESQGFIWGGRWYHYDTMHFEYRPEFFDL